MDEQLKTEIIQRLIDLELEISFYEGHGCDTLDELLEYNDLSDETRQLLIKLGVEV